MERLCLRCTGSKVCPCLVNISVLFSWIRCGLLCSVGMEGRAEGNPQLSPLAVPWFLLGTGLDDRLDSQSSACTPALWTFGCERGLRLPERNPWSTQGVGIESTAVIGLKPCSFGAAVLAHR